MRLPVYQAYLSAAYAQAGRRDKARTLLEDLQTYAQNAYEHPSGFARIYFALGEIDSCLDWLEKAGDEHDQWMLMILADSSWNPLRSHSRWKTLVHKLKLEP